MHKYDWPTDWRILWPNFSIEEMECKCGCGQVPEIKFMKALQLIRDRVQFALPVNSGFRCETYDKSIGGAGVHPTGLAADIGVGWDKAYELIKWATHYHIFGIGVKGRGATRYVHIDMIPENEDGPHPRPRVWTYNG